jgi:hypothetical protein
METDMETDMTAPSARGSTHAQARPEGGLIARLAARLRQALAAADAHCRSVEQAKEACERENLKKHGKDWVNRCCG